MSTPLSVLLVEDSEDDALLVLRELRRGGFQPLWQRVETVETLQAALASQPWDIIISDYRLPRFNASQALEILQQSNLDLPFIVISGTIGDALAVELMKAGAHDYLMKGNLARLPEAVRREIRDAQTRAERKQTSQDLHRTQERLQLALEGSAIGLWDWSIQTGNVTLNDRWAGILGYSLAELSPISIQTWYDYTHPEDLQTALERLEQHFRRESLVYECELRMRHRAGHWVWVWARGTVVEWDEGGNPLRMAGTHLDITDRKRAEMSLARRDRYMTALVNVQHFLLTAAMNAQTYQQILAILSPVVDADRLYIFENHRDQTGALVMSQRAEWCAPGIAPQQDNPDLQGLSYEDLSPRWLAVLSSGGIINGVVADFPETERSVLEPQGILTVLVCPMIVKGEFLGFIGFDNCLQLRYWEPLEVEFLTSAAAAIALAKEREQATQALEQLNRELEHRVMQRTAALQHSEARLRAAQQVARLGSWELDVLTNTITWSPEIFSIFGLDSTARPDFVNPTPRSQDDPLFQAFSAGERERFTHLIDRVLEGGETYATDLQITRADGSLAYIFVKAELNQNLAEQTPKLLGIMMDISDRKAIQEALQRSEERARATLLALPDLVFRVNRDGQYVDYLASPHGNHPARSQAVIGQSLYESLPPEVAIAHTHALKQALKTHTVQIYEQEVWIGDKLRYEEIRVAPCGNDEVVFFVRDISDRKQAELALQQLNDELEIRIKQRTRDLERQSNLLQTILNSMSDGVVVANLTGEILLKNPAAEKIEGLDQTILTNAALVNSPANIYLPNGSLCPTDYLPLNRALQGEATNQVELWVQQEDNPEDIYLEVTGRPLLDGTATPMGGMVVVRNVTDRKRDAVERQRVAEQILYNSLHDALTDLPNRNFLMQRLELAMQRSQRLRRSYFALLFLDLDHFKVINDSLGHLAGDEVLVMVAQKVRSLIRASDMPARLGGDEFVLLLEDVESLQDPVHVADRLFAELQTPLTLTNGREVFINSSIGIVMGDPDYQSPSDLLRDADIAMYRAKAQGRAGYVIFNEEMHIQALQRLQLEQDLRRAIDQGELVLYYQPIIHLSTGNLCGFEALVRWQHPINGFIDPKEFIPIAEETGLIVPLDSQVFHMACQQMVLWKQQFANNFPLRISINLSAQDLRKPDLIEGIDSILAETGLEGSCIILEITESMLIEDIDKTIDLLTQLKMRKIQISIDDFGTGFSSLHYLHRLPADHLKIDRSFVSQMQSGNRNYQIVDTIITLSNQLGVIAVAEGIESPEQLDWLRQLGCELGQGHFFSQPLTAQEVEQRFFQETRQLLETFLGF